MTAPELWAVVSLTLWVAFVSDASAQTPPHPQLDALVTEAVQQHPEVRRARRTAAAAWQVPARLDSLPDPMLSIAVQNLRTDKPSLDASPMSGIEIGLRQDLPFPGKLSRRGEVATEMARASDRSVIRESNLIALRVREAYWRLHFAEGAERIALENEKALGTLASTVLGRFSVGQRAQQDALQAQVAHSRVRALVEERHEAVQAAKHTLNGVVGRLPEAPVAVTEDPSAEVPAVDRQALVARAKAQNPTILLHRAQVLISENSLQEARYNRWPDLQLGIGYRFRAAVPGDPSNGADMFGVSFGLALPLWMGSKQNAHMREAGQQLEAANAGVEAADLDVVTQIERTVDGVERLNREIVLYENDVGPQSHQALEASISDYQLGRVGFVSVLQNWQVQLEVELTVVRLLTEREERLAEMQALVGDQP